MPFVPVPAPSGPRRSTTFPADPAENTFLQITNVGLFTFVDGRWVGASGNDVVFEYTEGIEVKHAVTVVAGTAVHTNRAVHLHATGVVRAIVGALAVIRRDGVVGDFDSFADGNRLFIGAVPGSIVAAPLVPSGRLIPIGWALPAGEIMVHLYEPRGV